MDVHTIYFYDIMALEQVSQKVFGSGVASLPPIRMNLMSEGYIIIVRTDLGKQSRVAYLSDRISI